MNRRSRSCQCLQFGSIGPGPSFVRVLTSVFGLACAITIAACQSAQQVDDTAQGEPALQTSPETTEPESPADFAARAAAALRSGLNPAARAAATAASPPAEVYEAPPFPSEPALQNTQLAPPSMPLPTATSTVPRAADATQEPAATPGTLPAPQAAGNAEPPPAQLAQPAPAANHPPAPPTTPTTAPGSALKIVDLALCSRIEAFGKYTSVSTARIRFGRPFPLLIYTELDGFAHTPSGSPSSLPQWSIELGQEVAIYRMSSPAIPAPAPPATAAHAKPAVAEELVRSYREEVCRDVAPRKRRDHYLVQRIELPGTLTPGQYRVKVTVRDVASGEVTQAAATITVER